MHTEAVDNWRHDHTFDQDKPRSGERRTLLVVALTAAMMVVEIAAGIAFGSMALLADGLHMASHAAALGLAAAAYIYARRHARNPRWSFGTGKVNALAGFASAVMLVLFALLMAVESVQRFIEPVAIVFDEAILVAVAGLAVNGVSALILGLPGHGHAHHHGGHTHHHGDHNLRAAFFHVLADALTSFLAIFALLAGKLYGLVWMDPMMGIVGAILVARWSWALLRDTGGVLLDHQAPRATCQAIVDAIEGDSEDRVVDLHVWSIGPNIHTAIISLVSHEPKSPNHYKSLLPADLSIVHTTVEIHHCRH